MIELARYFVVGGEQCEVSRWILLAVCVAGVVLAYATDEACSVIVWPDDRPESVSYRKSSWLSSWILGSPLWWFSSSFKLGGLIPFSPTYQFDLSQLIEALSARWAVWIAKFRLFMTARRLKRLASTKRHFFYLMEKQILGVPIVDGETEIDSYVDVKTYMGAKWPFMWEVSKVKDDRIVCAGHECYPMSSYSYLDLVRDQRVQDAAIAAAKEWSSGNHGPRMLGGNTQILCDLEKVIANFFQRDATLLCATGYLACMSACAAVSRENSIVFADSRLHASLRAGLKIGEGRVVWFKHNDFEKDCRNKLKKLRHKYGEGWMVIESVYSMDGDICDLPAAKTLCEEFNLKLMIDEAHGLGVVGETGRGVEELYGMQGAATLIVGTFSKSIASIGGYITGPSKLISYLDFHAPGNVFSAPLPAYCAGAAIRSFQLIDEEPEIVQRAKENARLLRSLLEDGGGHWPKDYPDKYKYVLEGDQNSTVLPVVFPDDIDRVMRVATSLKHKGYMCSAVAYPACPLRKPRFRITATSAYDKNLITRFVKDLVHTCVQEAPSKAKELLS